MGLKSNDADIIEVGNKQTNTHTPTHLFYIVILKERGTNNLLQNH